ncbi:MAG: acyl-CoA dehydrogenase family protein [Pseudomonadales bacterium]
MSLILNEEQVQLQDSAKAFVADNWAVGELRKLRKDTGKGYPEALWRKAAELGWLAIPFPEEYGGLGLGFAELGVVLEELGRGLVVLPIVSSVVLGGGALRLGGTDAQKQTWLPKVCDGSAVLTLACQETSRHDPYAVRSTATPAGDGYVLKGRKVLVPDGHAADAVVVVARTSGAAGDRSGLTLFIVEPATPGVKVHRNLLLDSRVAANIDLQDVRVGADAVVGKVDQGADVLDQVLAEAAAALSADMLGGIQQTFDITLEYLKVREQFGAKIGSFQGLKHRAARWFCEKELSKSIVLQTLRALDDKADNALQLASVCKARLSDTARLSGKEGIQMHGGIGVTDEHDIGLYMKRGRVSEMLFGDAAFHRNRFAELRGY